MLKTNDIKIEKIELTTTNLSVTFADSEVPPERFIFFKDILNKYKFYIKSEYSLKTELQYDKSSQLLTIGIKLIVPNQYLPNDPNKANEILMEPINTFQLFYEAENEIYKRKHRKI
ncbi:MAG TPA: hypothetical protein VF324_00020 [Methanobacterium sp.]